MKRLYSLVLAWSRTPYIPGTAVFGLSLILQLVVGADYDRHSPFFSGLICDSKVYDTWATSILHGDWIGHEVFHQAPLYPYVIALLWSMFGQHYAVIYLGQALMLALTVLLVFLIGRACFHRCAGWVAALLCLLYGPLNFYALKVLPDTLGVLLHVALAYALLAAQRPRHWLWAGILCALLIIARPHALLLVPLIPAWILWGQADRPKRNKIQTAGDSLKNRGKSGIPELAEKLAGTFSAFYGRRSARPPEISPAMAPIALHPAMHLSPRRGADFLEPGCPRPGLMYGMDTGVRAPRLQRRFPNNKSLLDTLITPLRGGLPGAGVPSPRPDVWNGFRGEGTPAPKTISQHTNSYQIKLIYCVAFLVPILLLVGGVACRNYTIEPDWVLISCNGGENFYMGNNPKADGIYCRMPGISPDIEQQKVDVKQVAESALGQPLTRAQISHYGWRKGLSFIRSDLARYFRLEALKLKRIFSGTEYTNMYFLWFERAEFTPLLSLFTVRFYFILPFAILGSIILASAWRRRGLGVLYLMSLLTVLNMLIFYVDERYRLPLIPFLILLGVGGTFRALQMARSATHTHLQKAGLALLFLAALTLTAYQVRTEPDRLDVIPQLYNNLGEVYYKKCDYHQALKMFYKSTQLVPNSWEAAIGVGKTIFAMGQKDMGVHLYQQAFPNLDPELQQTYAKDHDLNRLREYGEIKP